MSAQDAIDSQLTDCPCNGCSLAEWPLRRCVTIASTVIALSTVYSEHAS